MPVETFALVLGFPRSGTTLLRRILDAHPQISCPPETWATTACARFLQDIVVDGPPIGVRTGLGFLGIAEQEIHADLRALTEKYHRRVAGGKPVMVEKSGFDLFHLTELTELYSGHARFIAVVRHPLDTIASNLDLASRLGRFLPELQPFLSAHPAPVEALAAAWVDRTEAQLALVASEGPAACLYRYEDMIAAPAATLAPVFALLGTDALDNDQIAAALQSAPRRGLGDWKTYATSGATGSPVGRWTKTLSKQAVGQIVPRLAPLMERLGYEVPRMPKRGTRAQSIKQFEIATRLMKEEK